LIAADDVEPPLPPPGGHREAVRAVRPRVVADVMVAGDRVPGHRQAVKLLAAVMQIIRVVRPVERQVAEVDDQVGSGLADIGQHGFPVRLRLRRSRRQVGVRHQDHAGRGHT